MTLTEYVMALRIYQIFYPWKQWNNLASLEVSKTFDSSNNGVAVINEIEINGGTSIVDKKW